MPCRTTYRLVPLLLAVGYGCSPSAEQRTSSNAAQRAGPTADTASVDSAYTDPDRCGEKWLVRMSKATQASFPPLGRIIEKSPYLIGENRSPYLIGFVADLIVIAFHAEATPSERADAVAHVCGKVVGVLPARGDASGSSDFYYVQLPADSTGAVIAAAIDTLETLPQVETAMPKWIDIPAPASEGVP